MINQRFDVSLPDFLKRLADIMEYRKNDIIDLTITSMTSQGSGVGKTPDGMVIFVPQSAVGDKLKVRILKNKKSYAYGKIEEIAEPSAHRIEVDCPAFFKCGGCAYRHISYDCEKEIKYNRVKDAVERIGGFKDIKINNVVENENTDRYRNKAQLPCSTGKNGIDFGFFANHSHRIVPCDDCLLQPEFFKKVVDITREFMLETKQQAYDEKTGKGKLRHIYIRFGEATEELMVCYVVNGNGLKQEDVLVSRLKEALPQLKSVVVNSNRENTNVVLGSKNRTVFGKGYITDVLCGLKFKISPLSFYQVNRTQAEKLYNIAKLYADLKGDEVLLDLYCGTGTIGLTMAKNCKTLIGVEIVEQAIEDAVENAELNGIENARFISGDASFAAQKLKEENLQPDVVVIDPPRKGCSADLIATVCEMAPDRIVYVSCDPETLARDLKIFSSYYSVEEITPVDLFSRTPHIESVALLRKNY